MEIDSIAATSVVVCLGVILVVLFGPSLYSSYEDWKIKKGLG